MDVQLTASRSVAILETMLSTPWHRRFLSLLIALLGVWVIICSTDAALGKHYFKGSAGRYLYKATRAVASTDWITPVSIGVCGHPPVMVTPSREARECVAPDVVPPLLLLRVSAPAQPRSPPLG